MVPQTKRHRVSKAARLSYLFKRQVAAGHRNTEILARLRGCVCGKGKLNLWFLRHRTCGAGKNRFKSFEWGLFGHFALLAGNTVQGKLRNQMQMMFTIGHRTHHQTCIKCYQHAFILFGQCQ